MLGEAQWRWLAEQLRQPADPGKSGAPVEEDVAARLPENKRPRTIAIADEIPMTPVGKVLRRRVREICSVKYADK